MAKGKEKVIPSNIPHNTYFEIILMYFNFFKERAWHTWRLLWKRGGD